jgi:hypothetical protein
VLNGVAIATISETTELARNSEGGVGEFGEMRSRSKALRGETDFLGDKPSLCKYEFSHGI